MNDYDAIQKHIAEAKLQRAAYLGELVATAIIAVVEFSKIVISSVFMGAANRPDFRDKSIFRFDP